MTRRHQVVLFVVLVGVAVILVGEGRISDDTAYILAALVPSVILHEVSHGVAALVFGDDTAKRAGRLTLNPVAHVDPFGTVILPAMLAIATAGQSAFGYAKPVPVNPRRLRHPRNHSLLVGLVGPTTNIVLAVVAAVGMRLTDGSIFAVLLDLEGIGEAGAAESFFYSLGAVNVILAVFNLLPIPPLDGSAVVERMLPPRYWERYLKFRQYAPGLVLVLVLVFPQVLDRVFDPALALWERLL
ncbi:MAG TPA: site-2 protease family protein [Acidimicrobiales bacterium]|nr:site-2 protease family protein [Acidimicrobiales bacterium]